MYPQQPGPGPTNQSWQYPPQNAQQPQYAQQSPYGQQFPHGQPPQYGQPQALGFVDLTVQGSMMTSNLLTPEVWINGYRIPAVYGYQQVPIPAGPVHIEAHAQWMVRYGQAALDFTLQPGQRVPVFYAAPMHQFTTGSMGFEKQSRKGVGAFIGMMTAIVLLVLLPFVLVSVL